jgi:1-acyl-sn-glycerol-3-phosphate acyltransferase
MNPNSALEIEATVVARVADVGGVGDSPAPLGNRPGGTGAGGWCCESSGFPSRAALVRSDGSSDGTGGSPVLAALKERADAFVLVPAKAGGQSNKALRLFRTVTRLAWLGGEFILASLSFVRCVTFQREIPDAVARARWLQRACQRMLRVFHVRLRVHGTIPTTGLLVCNHLSYLDIIVLGALAPAIFVAKLDVKRWPVLGWFARLASTLFIARGRRKDTARSAEQIEAKLRAGMLVVLFPEGTSTGGETVLPFKSSLLEPAARSNQPITAAFLRYSLSDSNVAEEVCYWKDMTLLPHLINLLGKGAIRASVNFAKPPVVPTNRKELALQLHSVVLGLRETVAALADTTATLCHQPRMGAPGGGTRPSVPGRCRTYRGERSPTGR